MLRDLDYVREPHTQGHWCLQTQARLVWIWNSTLCAAQHYALSSRCCLANSDNRNVGSFCHIEHRSLLLFATCLCSPKVGPRFFAAKACFGTGRTWGRGQWPLFLERLVQCFTVGTLKQNIMPKIRLLVPVGAFDFDLFKKKRESPRLCYGYSPQCTADLV